MTRVSENSSKGILNYNLNRAKRKLENLQLQGSNLKTLARPSDNPLGKVESLSITSVLNNNQQYARGINMATLLVNATERALEGLTDILVRAKEIAVSQSSDFFSKSARQGAANEIKQLRNMALAISNKRIGTRYLFAGFKSNAAPFNPDGQYMGDKGRVYFEIAQDFAVPVNLHGQEVFYNGLEGKSTSQDMSYFLSDKSGGERNVASKDPSRKAQRNAEGQQESRPIENKPVGGVLQNLDTLATALDNSDGVLIQSTLEELDDAVDRVVGLRTRLGAISNTISRAHNSLEADNVDHMSRKSVLEDADVSELFSDIAKQKVLLKSSYQANQGLINQTLLDFLK